jgi:hypothetical protein
LPAALVLAAAVVDVGGQTPKTVSTGASSGTSAGALDAAVAFGT